MGQLLALSVLSTTLVLLTTHESSASAIAPQGVVWAWGRNTDGQLGDGTTTSTSVPVRTQVGVGARTVAGGVYRSAANVNDIPWVWGAGFTATPESTEFDIAVGIAVGHSHTLVASEQAWGWGSDSRGQLGDGPGVAPGGQWVAASGLSRVSSVGAGWFHSLAVQYGEVWSWGDNNFGQLGDGTTDDKDAPVLVSGLPLVSAVAGGDAHSIALGTDGTVWTWGQNHRGQLGDGTTIPRSVAARVEGLTGIRAIAAGATHSLALDGAGYVWAWGEGGAGQIGDGVNIRRLTPVRVPGIGNARSIAAGIGHSVAATSDGSMWVWGSNEFGQLGDGTTVSRSIPGQIGGLGWVAHVGAGGFHTLATVVPAPPAITVPREGAILRDPTVLLEGTAPAGSYVRVWEGDAQIAGLTADPSGDWSVGIHFEDGQRTISAQFDVWPEVSPLSMPRSFVVDTIPPDTRFISPPVDSSSPTVVMSFEALDVNKSRGTFECSLDGGAFVACTSPHTYSGLSDGRHLVNVSAVDDAGNLDTTPVEASFLVDTSPPSLVFLDPAPGVHALGMRVPAPTSPVLVGPATVRARVGETLSNVGQVVFDVDGQEVDQSLVRSEGGGVYSFVYDAQSAGPALPASHVLRARAQNSVGLKASAVLTVLAV